MTTVIRSAPITAVVGSSLPIRAVLATSRKLADGYALSMTGARLDRFRANPALLVVHDRQKLPVGRVTDLKIERDRITGELVFASDPEAQMIAQRVREGIINAVSIGFDVDRGSVDREGNVRSWEMLEVSLVGLPMDSEALIYSRSLKNQIPRGRRVDRRAAQNLLDAFKLRDPAEVAVRQAVRELLMEKLGAK